MVVQEGHEHDRYVEEFSAHRCHCVEGFVGLGVEQELLAQRGEALFFILGLLFMGTWNADVSTSESMKRTMDAPRVVNAVPVKLGTLVI